MGKIKNYRKVVVFFIVISFVSLFTYLFFKKSKEIETPTVLPALKLIQTNPLPGNREMLFMGTAILFEFDSPIDISTAIIIINPNILLDISKGIKNNNILAISPVGEWEENTNYTITIKGLKTRDGKILNEDIEYPFKFTVPTNIDNYHPH